MIYETKVKYSKEGNQILINRIKSSVCYICGCLLIFLSIYFLNVEIVETNFYGLSISFDIIYLWSFAYLSLIMIVPLCFLYPTVRYFMGGEDSFKTFVLANVINLLIKLIITALTYKVKKHLKK